MLDVRLRAFLVAFAVAFALSTLACTCNIGGAPHTHVSGFHEMNISGPATWTIDGKPQKIEGTMVAIVQRKGLYAVRWFCDACIDELNGLPNEDAKLARAKEQAWPIARHAYKEGLFEAGKKSVTRLGDELEYKDEIGVAIIRVDEVAGLTHSSGIRVSWPVNEIEARLRGDAKAATTTP